MAEEVDRIAEVFNGKTVFISGATGFVGQVLIEKLLRVTEVKTLYLLIRQKKGKSPKERLQDIFNHVLFSVLKKERPDSIKKCVIISGDVMEKDLGIDEDERKIIQENVDFIFHSAATTRFNETLQYAVQMNTLGTKYMLDLAKECEKLKLFIHVSTAFAFPNETVLYEKTYDPPANPQEILDIVSSGKLDNEFEKRLLQGCPNTYTYSKALAEGLVNHEVGKLPLIIIRPAVVIPTFQEPISGFFNNLQSPMGLFVGAGKGVIRSMYMDSKSYANIIPVDTTINVILIAVWDYLSFGKNNVFNISVPREDLQINWEEIIEIAKEVIHNRIPFNGIIWYPGGSMTKFRWWHYINVALFQLIPALFIDLMLLCLGYKPVLFAINQRILKGQEMLEYFTTKSWNFDVEYFLTLRTRLNQKEKKLYKVDADNVDIPEYLYKGILYARRHILKETDEMLPAAKRNMKIFFMLDKIVKVGFVALVLYYIYSFIFARYPYF